ncbi:hypothetical protein H2203_006912 [Taxawa tesnikishii (nom. ined.)]|nr:hypothetical protein H2203_006912 [Dothideales sp. JES 119]
MPMKSTPYNPNLRPASQFSRPTIENEAERAAFDREQKRKVVVRAMVGEDYEDEGFDWCDLESDAPECWILRTFWYRAMRAQAQGKLFEDFFREEELFGLHKPAKATKNMSPAEKMWLEVPDWEKRMEILRNDWVLIAFAVFDIDITDDRRAKYGPVGRRDSVMPESAADNDSIVKPAKGKGKATNTATSSSSAFAPVDPVPDDIPEPDLDSRIPDYANAGTGRTRKTDSAPIRRYPDGTVMAYHPGEKVPNGIEESKHYTEPTSGASSSETDVLED